MKLCIPKLSFGTKKRVGSVNHNANEISFISLLKAESIKHKAFFRTSNKVENNTSQVKHTIGCKALALPKSQILLKDL